jgi:hypothetical protein
VFDAAGTETTVDQKLEVLRELLLDVSRAMLDIRMGVQRLYEKSRQAQSTDIGRVPADLR